LTAFVGALIAWACLAAPAQGSVWEADPDSLGPIPDAGSCEPGSDFGQPLEVRFDVPLDEPVEDVRVRFRLDPPLSFGGDYRVTLRSPQGVEHLLIPHVGPYGGVFGPLPDYEAEGPYLFWDGAPTSWVEAITLAGGDLVPPGAYRAEESINASFAGGGSEGVWTLSFREFCLQAGDQGGVGEAQLVINGVEPLVELTGPEGPTRDPRPTFRFHDEGESERYECSIDQGEPDWGPCSDPQSHTPDEELADGSYTFRLRVHGRFGADVITREFEVDTLPPAPPKLSFEPGEVGKVTVPRLRAEAGEEAADVLLWESAGCGEGLLWPFGPAELADGLEIPVEEGGTIHYSARARDAAGNRSTCVTASYRHDAIPPTVAQVKVRVKARRRAARATFKGSDDVTPAARLAFSCRLDRRPWRPCRSPLELRRLAPGRHVLRVRTRDEAGNQSRAELARFSVPRAKRAEKAR
jgi:hypothetical protein